MAFQPEYREARIISELKRLDPYLFEELILTSFEAMGLKIKRSPSYSGDGGFDGQVFIEGNRWLIQSKCYTHHIHSKHVFEFSSLVNQGHVNGFFVHTGKTGRSARMKLSRNVRIISGSLLSKLILGTLNTTELTGQSK